MALVEMGFTPSRAIYFSKRSPMAGTLIPGIELHPLLGGGGGNVASARFPLLQGRGELPITFLRVKIVIQFAGCAV